MKEKRPGIATLKVVQYQGAWVAQPVKRLTSAQVVISQFVGSSSA